MSVTTASDTVVTARLLAVVVLLAAAIQSAGLPVPLTSARDTQSAAIARHLREDGLPRGLLYPRGPFSADGGGTVLMEFPLVAALGAGTEALVPALGERAYRLPSMAFGALAVVALFDVVRRRAGGAAALAAAALLAFSPLHLEMAASPRPDEGAFALALAALALADRARLKASAAVLALALLAKTTFAAFLVPWAILVARPAGFRRAIADPKRWLLAALALAPAALWHWHAERVNAQSSLMGSLTVLEAASGYARQKGRLAFFVEPRWYAAVGARLAAAATIAGSALAAIGAALVLLRRRADGAGLAGPFALAFAALLVLFPWNAYDHRYYVLAGLPLTALCGGLAIDSARRGARAFGAPLALALLAPAAIPGAIDAAERLRQFSPGAVAFGETIRRATPEGSLVIVCAPIMATWDGSLLYRAERAGWRYSTQTADENDPADMARLAEERRARGALVAGANKVPFSFSRAHYLDGAEVERLRARGATHFAYAGTLDRLRAERLPLARHLVERYRLLVESGASPTVFDLRARE